MREPDGYLTKWYVDIGGRVKEGQLLATIDTPEIDQQLKQAEAARLQAQANLDLAKTTADRWHNALLKSDGVFTAGKWTMGTMRCL